MKQTTSSLTALMSLFSFALASPMRNVQARSYSSSTSEYHSYETSTTTTPYYTSTSTPYTTSTTTPYTTTTTTTPYTTSTTTTPYTTSTTTTPYYSTTTTTTTTSYAAPSSIATYLPKYLSLYSIDSGAVQFNSPTGLVSKASNNNGHDTTTLFTFWIDSAAVKPSDTCEIVFDLSDRIAPAGSAKIDVFTSIAPAWVNTSTWPQGNLRDHHKGRLDVKLGKRATVDSSVTAEGLSFPCSDIAGMYLGGEVVGVFDNDFVQWTAGVDGIKILVHSS